MRTERDFALGDGCMLQGVHTLLSCTLQPVLLGQTNVTPIKLIKMKNK